MIIYEVNIIIDKSIYNDYRKWLDNHIKLMLCNNGFIKSAKYKFNEDFNTISICVQYYIKSKNNLEEYFLNYSDKMRKEGFEKFRNGIQISRRILECVL